MVKFHKRNFITVLLIACVVFSFVSPVFAAETTTAPAAAPAYTRGYLGETSFGDSVRSVLTDYSVAFGEVADGMKSGFDEVYQNFIALFESGGTDKNGVAQAAVSPVTDSNGYKWYRMSFTGTHSSTTTDAVVNFDGAGSFEISARSSTNTLINIRPFPATKVTPFVIPTAGNYVAVLMFSSSSGLGTAFNWDWDNKSRPIGSIGSPYVSFNAGQSLTPSFVLPVSVVANNSWHNFTGTFKFYMVDVGSSNGVSFQGFGGGQTRGGGAGRRLDLIPAAKAGEVAAGGALTGSDVLQDYSLFDETSKVISIPQSDGTSITYTANTWVYNYETRTYNITTTNDTVVNITYGNDKATVTDGSNPPVDYYYASSDSSGGGGNDDGGGGFWDKILGGLADGILGFFNAVGVVLASIATGLVDLLTKAVESVGSLVALVGSLGAVVGGFFAFLPVEVQAAVSAGLIVVITFSVISVLRK